MPTTGAPGVSVTEQLNSIPLQPPATVPSVFGFLGESYKGPSLTVVAGSSVTDEGGPGPAMQCNSWSDYVRIFGGFNPNSVPLLADPYLPYEVYEFFRNGGTSCWVSRLASSTVPGTSASVTLSDTTATPQQTLKLIAGALGSPGNVGVWGNNIFVVVTAMPTTGRFTIAVYYGGTTQSQLQETWYDLSMAPTDARYAPMIINSPTQGSNWIVAIAITDKDVFPANQPAIGPYQFTGGVDTADPGTQDWINAMTSGSTNAAGENTAPFDQVQGPLTFSLPGQSTSLVVNQAIVYSETRPYSFYAMDSASGLTPSAVISAFAGLSPVVSNAAMYYPWVQARNPASPNLQSHILLPNSGFVLGLMAATDAAIGPWQAPAGITQQLHGVASAERVLSPTDLANLNNSNVNALRTRNGRVIIWGTRTMQAGFSTLYVPVRRTLNYIEYSIASLLEGAVFDPNDQATWSLAYNICTQFLNRIASQGAFGTATGSNAFYVICNSTNNTPQSIPTGILNVTVGVALLSPAEFIQLLIQQIQGNVTINVAQNPAA